KADFFILKSNDWHLFIFIKKLFGNFQPKHKLIRNIISTEANKIYKTESYFQFLFDVYLF
ncbi:MAG: hypothetical protein ACI9JY_002718, partial [Saprospiraceae bacterium]